MSACNIVVLPSAVHLFADGAAYDQDGRLASISSKVYLLGSISAAMVSTGRAIEAPFINFHLERQADSFDHLMENISEWLPPIVDYGMELFGDDDHGLGSRLIFGGYSHKRQACCGFGISTFGDVSGHEAYEVTPIDGGMQSPVLSAEELVTGFGHAPSMNDAKNIERLALITLELQRQQKLDWADGHHLVGGFAELVTVTKDQVLTKILKRWPDQIGEYISPDPVDWPAWRAAYDKQALGGIDTTGMSRAKRELMERKLRKGTLRAV